MAGDSSRVDGPLVSDCPIQPHVWREYRTQGDVPLELIAYVREGDSANTVANALSQWLDLPTPPVAFDRYVLVDVGFRDLVTALLPLTRWADLLRRVAGLADHELQSEVDAAQRRLAAADPAVEHAPTPIRRSTVPEASVKLSHEDYGRLRWLLAQVLGVLPGVRGPDVRAMLQRAIERAAPGQRGPLESVGYNRWVEPAVSQTRRTIKADAAEAVFGVDCATITWAVVDTGIDARHPMFADPSGATPRGGSGTRVLAAYDIPAGLAGLRVGSGDDFYVGIVTDEDWERFARAAHVPFDPSVRDERFGSAANDHGTHVAGILAGGTHRRADLADHWQEEARGDEPDQLVGICPTMRLIDIRVFDQLGRCREFEVVVGLAFLGWLNRKPDQRVDGVNVSLSIPFAVDNYACGWTPVCVECDRLVSAGVVVVASAGNSGYDDSRGPLSIGAGFQLISISDPGNADRVITVGATHRTDPHRYGPISRSARGPTADGRNKPDLLAPGDNVWGPIPDGGWGRKSGTSQAAPHVSGVAAMLLARYPELRGRPERVKQILCDTATDLGRLIDFQGHGLVDALRALQEP